MISPGSSDGEAHMRALNRMVIAAALVLGVATQIVILAAAYMAGASACQ